jgi:hypothetical protein
VKNVPHQARQEISKQMKQSRESYHERKEQRQTEKREEMKARVEERIRLAREHGKHTAQRESNSYSANRNRKSVRGYAEFAGRTPRIEPVLDPFNSWLLTPKKPKPKSQTTTIHTDHQTIKISTRAKEEHEKHKKKKHQYYSFEDFYDPGF